MSSLLGIRIYLLVLSLVRSSKYPSSFFTSTCLSCYLQIIIIFQGGGCKRFVLNSPSPPALPLQCQMPCCIVLVPGWGEVERGRRGSKPPSSDCLSAPGCHPSCLSVRTSVGRKNIQDGKGVMVVEVQGEVQGFF